MDFMYQPLKITQKQISKRSGIVQFCLIILLFVKHSVEGCTFTFYKCKHQPFLKLLF